MQPSTDFFSEFLTWLPNVQLAHFLIVSAVLFASIVARALFTGLAEAVAEMKRLIQPW